MEQSLFKQYAEIKTEIAYLKERESELNEKIISGMKKEKKDKEENDFGKFTIVAKTSYTFSPKIESLEEKVAIAKVKEIEKGIAKEKVSNYLKFTAPKNG